MKNKEIIQDISFAIAESSRVLMIDTIKKYASDEYDDDSYIWDLAKNDDSQLRFVLHSILQFYIENEE